MRISIIILTFNRANFLKNILNCLSRQTIKPFEVIIIDNFSRDETKNVVFNFKKKLPIRYRLEKKKNLAELRNVGIKLSRGDTVAFLDDDTEISKNWIKNLKDYFEKNKDVDIICGYLDKIKGNFLSEINHNITEATFIMANKFGEISRIEDKIKVFLKTKISEFFNSPVFFTGATTMVIRREVFRKIGLFDKKFAGAEELDFQLRMLKNNVKMVCLPLKIRHHYKSTLPDILRQYFFYGTYEYLSFLKHKKNKNLLKYLTSIKKSFLLMFSFPILVSIRYVILNKEKLKLQLILLLYIVTLLTRISFLLGAIYFYKKYILNI
jgi:GT2 family glycosyltransferase